MSLDKDLLEKIADIYKRVGTISGTAREVPCDRMTVRKYLKSVGMYDDKPLFAGRISSFERTVRPLPKKGATKRYILTCVQNNTKINQRVWDNLLALADHYRAEMLVATFTYNRASFGSKSSKKGKGPTASDREEVWYDPEVEEYINDTQVEIAPSLVWCGEMNILPTAVKPLQGLEVYTERKSGIFPHVKMHMQSIASGKYNATKFNYTTGAVTKRNYIAKKAGLKADFHHVYGGLIVEVDHEGNWYCRQLIADSKGVIYDLDLKVDDCEISKGNRVDAITWGDIHEATIDKEVERLAWGKKGMLDTLRPKFQFMHDVIDFRSRNVHVIKRGLIHERFRSYIDGHDSVEKEIISGAEFLNRTSRPWCKTIVVYSNHDEFMVEWLRIGDYRHDPINAIYFLECQLHVYGSIKEDPRGKINLLRWAVDRVLGKNEIWFLDEDESFVQRDIEYGMHGHLGPNGSRGTAGNLARMGRKMTRGHEHSAGIFEGVYTAGVTGKLDQGYNVGPSSWSPSHVVTYANGKRAIYSMWNGKWRA